MLFLWQAKMPRARAYGIIFNSADTNQTIKPVDSFLPGVMVDGEVAFDGKDDGLILMIGHPLWPRHEGGSIPHQTRPGSSSG